MGCCHQFCGAVPGIVSLRSLGFRVFAVIVMGGQRCTRPRPSLRIGFGSQHDALEPQAALIFDSHMKFGFGVSR